MQKPLVGQIPGTPYIEVLKEVDLNEAAGKTLYATVSAHGEKNRLDYVMVTVHTDGSQMMGQYMIWTTPDSSDAKKDGKAAAEAVMSIIKRCGVEKAFCVEGVKPIETCSCCNEVTGVMAEGQGSNLPMEV